NHNAAIGASGAMIHYVKQTQKTTLEHITSLLFHETANYLVIDPSSIRNLELVESVNGDAKETLLSVINRTRTGMGARLLRSWLVRPSIDPKEMGARLDAVAEIVPSPISLDTVRASFEGVFDLERLLGKITVGTAAPRELTALRSSIQQLPAVGKVLGGLKARRFEELLDRLDLLTDLQELLATSISDEPPLSL